MSEFFASFSKTIDKLWQMQQRDTPALLLEGFAKVLRFGLVAICIAALVFAIQFGIALCVKQQRKTALPLGALCALCGLFSVWAFLPIVAAPQAATDSAAVQTLHYISTQELSAQEAAAAAESEAAQAAPADATTTSGESSNATGAASDTGEDDEEENPQLDNALHRTVANQTELTWEQASAIAALLEQTQCTRTMRMRLPQKNAQNILLRLENEKKWQILILQDEGYVYATETTGFLCKIKDYATFYKQLQGIVA